MCKNRIIVFHNYPYILVLLLVCLTACNPSSQNQRTPGLEKTPEPALDARVRDESWYKSESCLPPCWHGLEIGRSSKEEAIKVVNALPFVESGRFTEESITLWDQQGGAGVDAAEVKFFYEQPRNMTGPILFFVDSTLVGVSFSPNYPLTVKTVVEHLGDPDYVYSRPVTPEIIDCEVNVIWADKQLTLIYSEQFEKGGRYLCEEIRDRSNKIPAVLQVNHVLLMLNQYRNIPFEKAEYRWSGFYEE